MAQVGPQPSVGPPFRSGKILKSWVASVLVKLTNKKGGRGTVTPSVLKKPWRGGLLSTLYLTSLLCAGLQGL
eukprot:4606764-Amphidinium_carterae.2